MADTVNYDINYEDERFKSVETDRKAALTENEQLYTGMASEAEGYYQAQADLVAQYAVTQEKNQQAMTDHAIAEINQQKKQTTKDYQKEQSGAYVDWQKESNKYGVNAEQMAAQGLANTGYSESSQVSMYNTYQNRVATAKESYDRAIVSYNNAITEARLQNNSILAEIAFNSLQQQLELSLQGFQYKNNLLLEMANQKTQIETRYDNKYQAVLAQMNHENALAEDVRQYNQNYAMEQNKYNESIRQFNETMAEDIRQYNTSFAEDKRQYDSSLAEQIRQYDESLKEEKRQYNANMALQKAKQKAAEAAAAKTAIIKGGNGASIDVSNVSTYEDAAKALRTAGVTKGDGGLMTKSEWSSRKSRGSTSAEVQYSSYEEYLNNYVSWKTKNPD